jgi:hypothetical protein
MYTDNVETAARRSLRDGLRRLKMTARRIQTMLTATGRSAAAKKASETRKHNKYEAMRDEAIQSARRQHLYDKLTGEQRDAIDTQLDSSTCIFEDEFEEFIRDKEAEVMDDIRALLSDGIHPAMVLCALEVGNCEAQISTGHGGFTIDKQKLLGEVLLEEDFRALDVYLDEDEVSGIDNEDFDIPPALKAEAVANI